MRISYLGPKETFTEQAVKLFVRKNNFENVDFVDLVSLELVAKSVALPEIDMGIMAYYNYLEGLVQECLDLIYENNLSIIGMQRLSIIFSIGAHKENINQEILSHPKALAQCSGYLWKYYENSRQIAVASTAAAAKKVAETKFGLAIASQEALLACGLEIIAEDIGNKRYGRVNFTDFYLVSISKEFEQKYNPEKKYLTMIAITPHVDKIGLLAEITLQIAKFNLNIVKVHSRPALDDVMIDDIEPQMFYLEIESHQDNDSFEKCVDSLKDELMPKGRNVEVVRVLGSYEKPEI